LLGVDPSSLASALSNGSTLSQLLDQSSSTQTQDTSALGGFARQFALSKWALAR
jgi:hypothetical protein